jgi:ATP/maltotriose-dependent transcriptional regulator MalT
VSEQYKLLQTLYPLLSKLYAAKGNPELAATFLDSALYVKDSLARQFNAMLILRAQQKLEREREKAEVEHITSEKKIEILKRNILVVVVVLFMLLSVYAYRRQQKKQLLAKEKLQKSEAELRLATKQLDEFTSYISEKNNFIEILQQQLDNGERDALQQLHKTTILTDDEWEYFRQLFEKVHGGYLQRLKEKLPGLTPAETRFMALGKLKFSNKEMAATLGVSPQAMRVTWHRLRKKLELPEESSADELINSL